MEKLEITTNQRIKIANSAFGLVKTDKTVF